MNSATKLTARAHELLLNDCVVIRTDSDNHPVTDEPLVMYEVADHDDQLIALCEFANGEFWRVDGYCEPREILTEGDNGGIAETPTGYIDWQYEKASNLSINQCRETIDAAQQTISLELISKGDHDEIRNDQALHGRFCKKETDGDLTLYEYHPHGQSGDEIRSNVIAQLHDKNGETRHYISERFGELKRESDINEITWFGTEPLCAVRTKWPIHVAVRAALLALEHEVAA